MADLDRASFAIRAVNSQSPRIVELLYEPRFQRSDWIVMDPDGHGPASPERDSTAAVSSYWEAEKFVLCDRKNPRAWIKSDVTVTIDRSDSAGERAVPGPEE